MSREIRLGDLSEREKENVILVLEGYTKTLKAALERLAEHSVRAQIALEEINETYATRLGFLDRHYERVYDNQRTERTAARMDQFWRGVG